MFNPQHAQSLQAHLVLETRPPFRLILHWKRLALDTAQKPYYCVSKYPHVGAVLLTTALLGHAPARSTRASAANRRDNISAYWRDDSVIATGNVTSKRRFMSARSIPAPCGGPCEEQKSTRKQGAPSALS
jgi:hypothetical protein